MQNFMLSTDSCCDIYKTKLKDSNVHNISLGYIHNGTLIRDDFDSDKDYSQFYGFLRSGNLPTTTQLNIFELKEYFERLLSENSGDIVHISLSSGLSGTYNNAVSAAKELETEYPNRKIYVVDSLGATVGQMLLVDEAIRLRHSGMTAEQTFESLTATARHTNYIFMPTDLFHLRRGGRVSTASALVGTILQIKPLLCFDNLGRLVLVNRVKGITKALNSMIKHTRQMATDIEKQTIYIAHSDAYETANELKAMLQEHVQAFVKIAYIGPIIGAHTGPGTIGIVCVGKERH